MAEVFDKKSLCGSAVVPLLLKFFWFILVMNKQNAQSKKHSYYNQYRTYQPSNSKRHTNKNGRHDKPRVTHDFMKIVRVKKRYQE